MEEIDLKEIILVLWKKKLFIIIPTLILGLITFLAFSTADNLVQKQKNAKNSKPLYYAETHFIVGTSETLNTTFEQAVADDTVPVTVTEKSRIIQTDTLIHTYREIIKSRTSLTKIIDELELNINPDTLVNLISFSRVSDSDLLCLTVAYEDENKAIQIANAVVDEFIKNMEKAYSLDQVSVIDEAYLLSDLDIALSPSVSQISTPTNIAKTSIDKTLKYTIIAAVAGCILSASIILIIEMFDNTIKSEKDLEKLTNSSAITIINKNKVDNQNQFSVLKTKLENIKTIFITTPETNNDLPYISNNLADMFSKTQNKVLLIDFSSDKSILAKKYTCKSLLEFIKNKNNDISKLVSKSTVSNFDILYIDSNTDTCLNESEQKKLITSLVKIYDTVIVSSDNLLENAHTISISKVVKNTVMVTNERKTKIDDFIKAKESIDNIKEYVLIK